MRSYLNPVYSHSFPDPYVLKHDGRYFGYSTGFAADGDVFGVIVSDDLVAWTEAGGAMKPLEPSPPFYWAPEVTYSNGKFYLYYSVGNETLMEIRVAVSDRPDGGFVDSGHRLTHEDFAIDAHVFTDDDGSKYFFYATDFLEHTYIGTGTVVDRMVDWFTLAGSPRPVARAEYDWQVYDPHRKEKGGVRWHTVEGPTVLKRKDVYYEMFSGGNWQNTTYGISFAVTNDIETPDEWKQFCDGEKALPILRTEPEVIVGPGHNSVVRGPNNRELYCVYHRWTDVGRVLAIDRMDFAGNRIFIVGATHTPQPLPFAASINDALLSNPSEGNTGLKLDDLPTSFLCEITFRCGASIGDNANVGFNFGTASDVLTLAFDPDAHAVHLSGTAPSDGDDVYQLPAEFDWNAKHLLRVESDFRKLRIKLDEGVLPALLPVLVEPVDTFALRSQNLNVEVSSFQLTEGFEELFEDDEVPLASNGWRVTADGNHRVKSGELFIHSDVTFEMSKHRPVSACEFAANFRVTNDKQLGEFGLILRAGAKDVLRFSVDRPTLSLTLNKEPIRSFPNAAGLKEYHQLRIIKSGNQALCYFDDALVKEIEVKDVATSALIFCDRVSIAVEMVRLTAL